MPGPETVIVRTKRGSLRGKKVSSVRCGTYLSFQGIPYGKPPVGNLRFKAPVEAESWVGIRDATTPGKVAPSFNALTQEYIQDSNEDCLYLNVYTPRFPDKNTEPLLAVMFWIHGGGFSYGSGDPELYSPDYLVTEDVVVVTCNYRLGALGFLSVQSPECPGNNGLKDIVLALKWCQRNISAFGGNPYNVTVFGGSAGGAAAHYLTLTTATEGLFHKVIAQSGVCFNPWGLATKPRENAFKLGEILGKKTKDEKELLKFLRSVSAESIVRKGRHILKIVEPKEFYLENAFVPCIEPETKDALITKHPEDIYKLGELRRVPFLLGGNTMEGLILLKRGQKIPVLKSNKELERFIPRTWGVQTGTKLSHEIVAKIRKFYFPEGFNEEKFVDLLSRLYFLNGISQVIEHHCNFPSDAPPTYVYEFSYSGNLPTMKNFMGFDNWKGTCHADELVYLFKQNFFDSPIREGTKDYKIMETLTKFWTNFAKTGCPVSEGSDSWKPINKDSVPYMDIGENITLKSNYGKQQFEFWKEIQKIAELKQKKGKL